MRLIDADAYENEMSKAYGDDWDKLHILESMPTVDAVEQKHGHWIKISPASIYECSVCNKDVMTSDIEAYQFCHKCGAKMDEVTEDNE